MDAPKILVTGVTGYIGGSVLTHLLNSTDTLIQKANIYGLVRGEDKAEVLKNKGIQSIVFNGFEDAEALRKIASEFDVIIDAGAADKAGAAKAMVLGLGDRRKATGRQTHFIHESGTSNLGDRPITGLFTDAQTHSDLSDIFAYEEQRSAVIPYDQREADLTVYKTGVEQEVKTYIIMAPTIFGIGSGLLKTISIQIPIIIRSAIEAKQAQVIGNGTGVWTHVHIADLCELYELILQKALKGEPAPNGKDGMYFAETGSHSWLSISERVGKVGHELGVLDTDQVKNVTLVDVAAWCGGSTYITEVAFASNARCTSDRSRSIGWNPKKTEKDWEEAVREDFAAILNRQ
ncbi:hypothetical protein HDV00_010473 [Rhizophlyctis rosea]|nr:hypothetical protein HDV00_010473 [Rhizophlyctis rosea]